MDSIDPVISLLMAKYARREPLTPKELQLLEAWWEAAPENRELAGLVRDEKWVEEALEMMEEAPEEEMWEEFSRRLDEKEGIVRPPAVSGFQPAIGFKLVAAAVVILIAVRTGWILIQTRDPAVVPRKVVSVRHMPDPAAGEHSVLLRKEETHHPMVAHIPLRKTKGGNERADEGPAPAILDAHDPAKRRENRYAPAPMSVDSAPLIRYCKAVVPSSTQLVSGPEYTDPYPNSYSAKSLQTILSKLDGPMEIHFNGKQMRVAGNRRFERAGAESSVKKEATPATPPAGFQFNETDFEQVLAHVADRYGLKVSNPEGLRGVAITGEFPRSSRPDSVLNLLQWAENGQVQLRLEQNTIVVSGRSVARGGP